MSVSIIKSASDPFSSLSVSPVHELMPMPTVVLLLAGLGKKSVTPSPLRPTTVDLHMLVVYRQNAKLVCL